MLPIQLASDNGHITPNRPGYAKFIFKKIGYKVWIQLNYRLLDATYHLHSLHWGPELVCTGQGLSVFAQIYMIPSKPIQNEHQH